MNWFEDLPEKCPPADAKSPENATFYRLCSSIPASSVDFMSKKLEEPKRNFAGVPNCILFSVSIWAKKEDCIEQTKFPTQKNKKVGKIILIQEDGLIQKTFSKSHYSWWRTNKFTPENTIFEN